MTRRGRPPHPDVLTPREWDVLTLIRDGLTNQQIAERLGISMDAAKYHVSEILSKLQLSSREEAAAWQPAPAERAVLRPVWASALAGMWRAWPLALRVAGAAVMASAAIGLGILAYSVLKSEDDSNDDTVEATSSASASASPGPSGSGTSTDGSVPDAILLAVTDGIDLPSDLALVIETGCWQCDGPTTSLLRVYRDAGGGYITDTLFTPQKVGLGPITVQTDKGPEEREPGIAGFAITPNASDIVVGVGYNVTISGSTDVSSLFRSTDGGITWGDFGTLNAGDFMAGEIADGQIIVGHYADSNVTVAPSATSFYPAPNYRFFPSNDAIPTPEGADATWRPSVLTDNTVGWITDDGRLLNGSGDEVYRIAEAGQTSYMPHAHQPVTGAVVSWHFPNSGSVYIDVKTNKDDTKQTFEVPTLFAPSTFLTSTTILGNVQLSYPSSLPTPGAVSSYLYPAILNVKSRNIQPITHPFGDEGFPLGRNLVAAATAGPFAVVTGTGSCLNVRSEAGASAQVLECAADGVLLTNIGQRVDADGQTWLKVRTPSGSEGFGSTQFLQVLGEPPSGD